MADDFAQIEEKWQKEWADAGVYESNPDRRPKFFATFPYPYLNGPLHIGHAFTATRVDVFSRFQRMNGKNVLFPFAFHATGEPIVGMAKRVKAKDPKQLHVLRESGVPDSEIGKFEDPQHIAAYYKTLTMQSAKAMGFAVDWRRSFVTIDEDYKKFIEWQYTRLREKGFVVKGTHPVIYCTSCKSPTGDHDRLQGEGASPEEFILIKFDMDGKKLVCGTLRPETVYGVTNIWVNPESSLVEASVDGEDWILSKSAAEKLKEQLREVKVKRGFKGSKIIGKECKEPAHGRKIPILPAVFVDECNATGIVMSVPSHAPLDHLALRDAGSKIKPISIIRTPSYGEHPAIEVCERLGVESQTDPKAEEATKEVYKKEFHEGVLKENCGEYAGLRVSECKDRLKGEFKKRGWADAMFETDAEVVCRCGNKCIVKILKDQWFLKYSDEKWKQKVRECLARLKLYPEEIRLAFENTVEWLQDKACARRSGLGTNLPWDKDWIVETLSDSTLYPAFYAIAGVLHERGVHAEQLSPEVFDYLFNGEKKAEAEKRVEAKTLDEAKAEFDYWYPCDFRNSADELVPNHLTFYLFHHTALLHKEDWPTGIGVNGMLLVEGEKMSKSKGNFITIRQLLEEYGADVARCNLMYSAEGLAEPDWRRENALSLKQWLSRFLDYASLDCDGEADEMDDWIESRLQKHVAEATRAFEKTKFRTALQQGFFEPLNDLKWYSRRKRERGPGFKATVSAVCRMLSPFAPHVAEEAWEALEGEGFCCNAAFPKPDESKEDKEAELGEELVKEVIGDGEKILPMLKEKPSLLRVFVAAEWKRAIYATARQTRNPGELIRKAMESHEVRAKGKEAVAYVNALAKNSAGLRERTLSGEEELKALESAAEFIGGQLGVEVEVVVEEEAEEEKAEKALPFKPALLFTSS